jgi:hypothetical protein
VTPLDYNYTALAASVLSTKNCRSTCTQSTNAKCSKEALSSYFIGNGVKLAFCTDVHLVIWATQIPSWGTDMYIVPEPTSPTGETCYNREYTANWKATHIPINFYDSGSAKNIFDDPNITAST